MPKLYSFKSWKQNHSREIVNSESQSPDPKGYILCWFHIYLLGNLIFVNNTVFTLNKIWFKNFTL